MKGKVVFFNYSDRAGFKGPGWYVINQDNSVVGPHANFATARYYALGWDSMRKEVARVEAIYTTKEVTQGRYLCEARVKNTILQSIAATPETALDSAIKLVRAYRNE